MFIIVLGKHVSILIESSSGPSKNTDPEDDSIRIETCYPNTIINNRVLLCLSDTLLYIYICLKHFGVANFK